MWVTVVFLLCVLFVFIYVIATTQEEGINTVTSLNPGSHFVDRPPFIVNVDHNEVAILTKYFWYYDITFHKVTVVPNGSLGFVFIENNEKRIVHHRTLEPGTYRIDLDKYKVTLFDMTPKTFTYGKK